MAKNKRIETTHKSFEDIKRLNQYDEEFWMARELAKTLDYTEFRNFSPVVEKAKKACKNSEQAVSDHFVEIHEMVDLGSGAQRKMASYAFSRYACYLIVQNADANKPVIANGQTYFAIQTRRQELKDDTGFQQLPEDQKRLMLRNELATHNKQLAAIARNAGVKSGLDYAIFQNHGYKGLYGGLDNKAIHQHKGLKKSQKILDHMGSTELAANLFRATQTEDKLKRDAIKGKTKVNQTHRKVGAKVRQTIKELGGTMPENLPTPEQDIRQLEHQQKKLGNGQE